MVKQSVQILPRWMRVLMMIACGAFISSAALDIWKEVRLNRDEPIIWQSATIRQTPEQKERGVVSVVYEGVRKQNCAATIQDFWIGPHGNPHTTFDEIAGGYTAIGPLNVRFERPEPFGDPGIYIYRSRITHRCEDGIHNAVQPPDASWTVAP